MQICRTLIVMTALLSASLTASACATISGAASGAASSSARGVPGFDTRDYPGAASMQAWLRDSPYRWVGYYLPAPCYTGSSWNGRVSEIERMGWGIAVLFVGEQDWREAGAPAETPTPAGGAPRCTQANLTAEQGRADAGAAAAAAAAEGLAAGTVVYLNVERVERVSPNLLAYQSAWFDALLGGGRYTPGLYAHERNVEALYGAAAAAFARHGRDDAPRLWVASQTGFALERSPAESPSPWASVWQGAFDRLESWGGVTLRIDANVARPASPSR
jgi:hypothetical protein